MLNASAAPQWREFANLSMISDCPSASPSAPQAKQCEMSHFVARVGACNLILHMHVVVNHRVPTDQYHMTVSRALVSTHRHCVFWSYPLTSYFLMIPGLTPNGYMHAYKFLAVALAKSIYYSHRIEMVGEFERAKDDIKMCKATLFEIYHGSDWSNWLYAW